MAEDYETVLKENAQLKEQVATFEERTRGLAERERVLQDTLVTTHRLADEMKATARREAELQMREGELQREKIIEEGRAEEARIRSEMQTLRRVRRQLVEDFRATLDTYHRMMSPSSARTRTTASSEGARLSLRVQPRASRDGIDGWQDAALRVRVTAPPVDGDANAAVARLLARALGVSPVVASASCTASRRATSSSRSPGLGTAEIRSRLAGGEARA